MKTTTFTAPILLCTILLFSIAMNAQNKRIIDSLETVINTPLQRDTTLIKAYNDLGIQLATSNPKQAKKYIKKSLYHASKIEAPRGIAGSHNCMGIVYYYQKEYDSALFFFKKAYQINKAINHTWGQAAALHQMGAVQNLLNINEEAIQSFTKAGTLFKELGDMTSYAKSIENIGVSYNVLGHQKKALEQFLKANEYHEKLNNQPGIGRTYTRIGQVLFTQKEYKKGLEYLNTSLPLIEKTGNRIHVANILKSIGSCYREMHNYEQALSYYKSAQVIYQKMGSLKTLASVQYNIGKTYYQLKQYSEAINYQKKALKNYTTKGDRVNKIYSHNWLAKTYIKTSQLDSAKVYAQIALTIAKEIKNIEGLKEVNHTLAIIAEKLGNKEDAYTHYKKLSNLKDTLNFIKKEEQVRELQAKYDTSFKEKKITQLEQKNKETTTRYTLLLLGSGIGIIILGIFTIVFKKRITAYYCERIKLTKELDAKKKELTTRSLDIAKKNKVLEHLKEEVEQIQHSTNGSPQFQQLLSTINFNIKNDKDWENFKKYFEQLDKNFYPSIQHKYPLVSTNELRLMALMRMNLSSKEIARILNITQDSVRKARYRLRKKLKVKSNKELIDIILSA